MMVLPSYWIMSIMVSVGVTRPSSLLLVHAPDHNPPADFGFPYFDKSSQVAASLCWNMALPGVISAIFVWALESIPRHDPTVLFVRFFPLDIGHPLGSRGSSRKKFPQRSFMWESNSEAAIIRLPSGSHTCLARRLL